MKTYKKSLMAVVCMIVIASVALAYVSKKENSIERGPWLNRQGNDPVSIRTELVQDKVLKGSDGNVSVALAVEAAEISESSAGQDLKTDLVIVLDRSGSMNGQKINNARRAVAELMNSLTPEDRLALITYSNNVQEISPLVYMNGIQQRKLRTIVQKIGANGGTNLSGGLMQGIDVIMREVEAGRQRRLILVSDGLANQGITDPHAIGQIASRAVNNEFSISTVGVGYDFNELLMTNIADHGAGQYYFLENPQAFAQVFEKELRSSRSITASGLEIRIPLEKGVHLLHAGGYPVSIEEGHALINMGDLLSGQKRKIFLTFNVPTDKEQKLTIGPFKTRYVYSGCEHHINSGQKLTIACVHDQEAVMSSIDKAVWGEQVVQEDFNRLKDAVADAIRNGRKDMADSLIREYEYHKRSLNSVVDSKKVSKNLEGDVPNLRQNVEEAFEGSPSVVIQKQKEKAKALQYESYKVRRDKK